MEPLGVNEIREKFLSFFESKDHTRLKSFSLVPVNDESLLLINSGMAPLKPYFTGDEIPPNVRITTCQKCIRTPDIENVGLTSRHGTFFEMLGDFSFGDYFKEEIIPWSWEFCTEVMGLDPERLYVTVYQDDDEAEKIWYEKVGVPMDHISRLGKEDNFWEHGTGPCGPCSEIYYDMGEEFGCGKEDCKPGCDCDRFVEFWNLVFSQFDRQEDGTYEDLIQKNIDTGMGLERLAVIMQGVNNIFEIDTVKHVLDTIADMAGVEYGQDNKKDISLRVITDHIRSVSFMLADGIIPGNEGRGYVLRRLLRRAVRHGRLLDLTEPFLYKLAEEVIKTSSDAYPELKTKEDQIKKIIKIEEERFQERLDQGLIILEEEINRLKENGEKIFPGQSAFKLYDTYGFPVDLTKEILTESQMKLDEETFNQQMEEQRERARKARAEKDIAVFADDPFNPLGNEAVTQFTGYGNYTEPGKLIGLIKNDEIVNTVNEGDQILALLDKTPLYAESGGQTGDLGTIVSTDGDSLIKVEDVKKGSLGRHIISGTVKNGVFNTGNMIISNVDTKNRFATQRNHTSTHLLQKALKIVLGDHVEQAGSYVSPERLRFDFNHFEAMTPEEIKQVENIVNEKILEGLPVTATEMPIEEAHKLGAMALFGEKYGDIVRVIQAGDFSAELCGGTHVNNTADIGFFKIKNESGVAAGIRRIEAVTGLNALDYVNSLEETLNQAALRVKTNPENVPERIDELQNSLKEKDYEINQLKKQLAGNIVDEIIDQAISLENGVKAVITELKDVDVAEMRDISDKIRDKLGSGIVLLAVNNNGKLNFIASATKDLVKKGFNAGNLVRETAKITGGGGGGRPDMAQAGGKNPEKLDEALKAAPELINKMFKK